MQTGNSDNKLVVKTKSSNWIFCRRPRPGPPPDKITIQFLKEKYQFRKYAIVNKKLMHTYIARTKATSSRR